MLLTPVGIQKRTVTAILGTALFALVVLALGLWLYRDSLVTAHVSQILSPYTEMIAAGAAPAIEANDRARAARILKSLEANPHILRADIITAAGLRLATYPGNLPPLEQSVWRRPDGIYVGRDVGEMIRSFPPDAAQPAHVFIRMSLAAMQQRDQQMLWEMALVVAAILGIIALLQFVLLRRWVLRPLAQLAAIAENAGQQGDYSQRMPAHDRDEFGQLGRSFNSLLAAVEQREKELRQLTSFQRAILNDAAYAIISTDTTGGITSLNPAAENLLGRPAADVVGKATLEVFHVPEEIAARAAELSVKLHAPVPATFETFAAEARRGLRSEAEWTCVRADGRRVPVLLSVTALRDGRGEIFGFLGMATDITERRQTEAKLRDREGQYRLLFENMVTGFALHEVICDGDGKPVDYRYLEVNPAFERLTGLSSAQLLGRTVRQVLPAVEKYWIETFGQVALTGKPVAFENYFSDLGRYYDTWVFSPKPRQFAVVFSDVTGRKIAEDSLHESRRLYEDVVSSVPLGVYRISVRDEGDVLEYVSDRFCEVTGLGREALLADAGQVRNIILPEDRASFDRTNDVAVNEGAPFLWEGRARVGGQTRWLHFESRPTFLTGRPPFWTGVAFDVTDRKNAEAEARQRNSLLDGTLQATADGILAVSGDGKITSYNRQFVELWRVPDELMEASDLARLTEFLHRQLNPPAAMPAHFRQFNDTSKAETFDTVEFADGRVFERFSRPQLVAGRVVGRVWSFRDVTDRHWAVTALRESENKFKTLFDTANDAILIMDDRKFLDCNRTAEMVYGARREAIIGQSAVHFSPERQADGRLSADIILEKIRAALGGAPQFFEWIHLRGDGTLFNAEVSLNQLELRGQTLVQAIVRDITARKQAERARQEAEELYRTLVNASPDGIAVLDMEGGVQFSSPRALQLMLGPQPQETGEGQNLLDFVSEQSRDRARELLRGALEEKFPQSERLVMRRHDGQEFVAELNGALLRDSLGVPRGIMVILRDVTERQRQEDELTNKNSELERFTYTVSHDLKSPLITITGFANAMRADAAAGRTDRLTGDLSRIVVAADKMSDLLNGLLELSRVGRIVHPPTHVAMDKLTDDVLALLAGTIAQRQAQVTVQAGLPPAYGDAQRLLEVMQNLVENALKFSPPDCAPQIEIGFSNAGGHTAYFVRDRGQGIEPRFHETIFGLFNKLDTRSEGTGIGLALVRRIVEFHGGKIWVESAGPGHGATFYFTLAPRKAT